MVRCSSCDREAPEGAIFCSYCGRRLAQKISPLAAVSVIAVSFIVARGRVTINLPLSAHIVSAIGHLILLLIPVSYMVHRRIEVRKYIMFGSLKHFVPGAGLGLALQGVSVFLSLVLTYLLGPSTAVKEADRVLIGLLRESSAATLLLMIVTGFSEEFAFRGFLQNALKNRFSLSVAIIGSSLAFAVVHSDPEAINMVTSFVMSLFFGYFYDRFQSYVMVTTAHATFNVVSVATLMLA